MDVNSEGWESMEAEELDRYMARLEAMIED
jgi:hypothetical protein